MKLPSHALLLIKQKPRRRRHDFSRTFTPRDLFSKKHLNAITAGGCLTGATEATPPSHDRDKPCAERANSDAIVRGSSVTRPHVSLPRAYWTGCGLAVSGGLVLSLGIVCLRAASASDAWQYLFWRAIGFSCSMSLLAAWRHARNPLAQITRLGGFAWISVSALVASQVLFVAAIKSGSTAEVFFLMSLAPLIAAVLARPLLGERMGISGVLAITVALGGVALMSGLSLNAEDIGWSAREGQWLARALALGTAFTFALYSLATRGARGQDLDAALVAVGIVTALVCAIALLWLGLPMAANLSDVALALLHGGLILALGLVLFARGSRWVPGVTLVMLAQAETVAAPVWTYLVFNETTAPAVIIGGALILAAVLMQAAGQARGTAGRAASKATQWPT